MYMYVYAFHNHHCAGMATSRSQAPARGLCNLRRTVPSASLSRGSAGAGRLPNSIRSGLRDWTAASSGNLYRRALAARWSALAILFGGRSRGNSGAATSTWRWNDEQFIESTTTAKKAIVSIEIQAQKINANGTEMIWEWHGIALIAYLKEGNK
jgi:hypothetical protein